MLTAECYFGWNIVKKSPQHKTAHTTSKVLYHVGPKSAGPVRYQVTTLGKLFTLTYMCRCTWSSGWCRVVTFRLWFDSHRGSFASNVEQVANLLHAQVNSASYPQLDGKWAVAYGLRVEGLVWLIVVVVCLLAANRGSSCSMVRAVDGRFVCYSIIGSCQSAATFEIVKQRWVSAGRNLFLPCQWFKPV